jgi:hypothetical protein
VQVAGEGAGIEALYSALDTVKGEIYETSLARSFARYLGSLAKAAARTSVQVRYRTLDWGLDLRLDLDTWAGKLGAVGVRCNAFCTRCCRRTVRYARRACAWRTPKFLASRFSFLGNVHGPRLGMHAHMKATICIHIPILFSFYFNLCCEYAHFIFIF